jgi:capsular exopolysaccharide synthesis family protein
MLKDQDRRDTEADFAELLLTLRQHGRRIAIFTGLTTLLAVVYVAFAVPQFAVDGSVYLGDARPSAPAGQATEGLTYLSDFQAVSDINTQIQMMNSRGLIEQAILETGLNAPVVPEGASRMRFWRWGLLHQFSINAFTPPPGGMKATDVVFADASSKPVSVKITMGEGGTYKVTESQGWFASPVVLLTGVLGQPASGDGLSLMLDSSVPGIIPRAGAAFKLTISNAALMEEQLQKSGILSISAGGQLLDPTKIATVGFLADNPYQGQVFVNQLMTDFITEKSSWNDQAAAATEAFISQQLTSIKSSLSNADKALADYKAQTGILDVPTNATSLINQLSQYETQRTALALQQEALQQLDAELDRSTGPLDPYLISQSGDVVLSALATNLATEESKLDALQVQFTGNAPEVQVEQATVARLQNAIRSVVGNELSLASQNLSHLDRTLATFNAQLNKMPAESLQVIALTRASDVYGQMYVLLMQRDEEAEVSKAAEVVDTRVITPANLPMVAAKPRPLIAMTIGLLVGVFGGIAGAIAQRAFSGRFQSEEEVRRLVKLPVYGVLPRVGDSSNKEMTVLHAQTPFAEAVRMLRGNIYRSGPAQQCRVVLLTSSGVDHGKTIIAMNLAKLMADAGKNVILVDADLHKGRLHELLNTQGASGLTDWLVTMAPPRVQPVPGQRFLMLSTGVLPPNPSELIDAPFLKNIFAHLRAEFDYVVIDSPPLPAVSDGLVLSDHADLVLSVVMLGRTSRQALAIHNQMLEGMDARHGIIINGVIGNVYGYGYRTSEAETLTLAAKLRRAVEWV